MPHLQVSLVEKEPLTYFTAERLSFAAMPTASFTSATINMLAPHISQTHHFHARPQGGEEIIFIYQGSFDLLTDEGITGSFDVDQGGAVYLAVPSGISTSIINTGAKPVMFLSIFAPPFELDELHFSRE